MQNQLVSPKQHVVNRNDLVWRVRLNVQPQKRTHRRIFIHQKFVRNHVLRKSRILRNYLVFPKQHVVTRKALVLHVCLSMQPQKRKHGRVFSRKNMSQYDDLWKSRIVRNQLVFPKQHVVTRKAFVLRVCLSVQPQNRRHRRVFSRKNM